MTEHRNDRLEQLMRDAGLSFKGLARAVRDAAARSGEYLGTDHTLVKKWVDLGVRPRGNTPRYVAEALSARLGRRISQADLGWPGGGESVLDRGLVYPVGADESADVLRGLWTTDLGGRRDVVTVPLRPEAWSQVAFRSLLPQRAPASPGRASIRVRAEDITAIKATAEHFN